MNEGVWSPDYSARDLVPAVRTKKKAPNQQNKSDRNSGQNDMNF